MRISENLPHPPPERTFRLEVTCAELEEIMDGLCRGPFTGGGGERCGLRSAMREAIMLALH